MDGRCTCFLVRLPSRRCTSVGEGMLLSPARRSRVGDAESRPMYWARFSLSFWLSPKMGIEESILKPECFHLRRLSAIFWLMSLLSKKNLTTRLRKHSVISWRLPNEMCMKLPSSSKLTCMEAQMPASAWMRESRPPSKKFHGSGD